MPRQQLPQIDTRLCTLCGDCVGVCPTDCLDIVNRLEVVVTPEHCISCTVCTAVCPAGATAMQSQAW